MSSPSYNTRRAANGRAAIRAGTPDYGCNGDGMEGLRTDASDAIANILHAVYAASDDMAEVEHVLEWARYHFHAEITEEEI